MFFRNKMYENVNVTKWYQNYLLVSSTFIYMDLLQLISLPSFWKYPVSEWNLHNTMIMMSTSSIHHLYEFYYYYFGINSLLCFSLPIQADLFLETFFIHLCNFVYLCFIAKSEDLQKIYIFYQVFNIHDYMKLLFFTFHGYKYSLVSKLFQLILVCKELYVSVLMGLIIKEHYHSIQIEYEKWNVSFENNVTFCIIYFLYGIHLYLMKERINTFSVFTKRKIE